MSQISFPSVQQVFTPAAGGVKTASTTPFEAQKNFASVLKESINNLNQSQNTADQLTQKLINGENVDLHQVLIASQKANITLQATVEVRNKAIEAYQEIMRMQV
ncbi:flagellar hook-basal body complex protein FliE [Neobacillus sp. SM06]|uniref:flagellar hook-basal body complex protein FliE n=1 Tax=Neobacillus sp. SM06 TaxID=3422492 RepID=UPI003D2C969C